MFSWPLSSPDTTLLSLLLLFPYPFLCPLAPRKGSWLADKVKRLIRPRREGALHGGPRLGADGAGSTESLGGPLETELPEGREADGTGGFEGLVTRMPLSHVSHPWHLPYYLACTCATETFPATCLQPALIMLAALSLGLRSPLSASSFLPILPPPHFYTTHTKPKTS